MSLVTDKFFAKALFASEDLDDMVGGRIYNTVDDEQDPDSAEIPSVIIFNNGTINQQESKDDDVESDYDTDTITLGISAKTREQLADIVTLVRGIIREAANAFNDTDAESLGFWLEGYNFSSSEVSYDYEKPCYWQELTYQCETLNKK